jgi:hypothetical protein
VQRAWAVVRQLMLLWLLGAGLVNFLLAEPLDGIMLTGFVVVVITISIYQEHLLRSDRFRSTGVGIRPSFGAAPSADQTANHGPCNCAGGLVTPAGSVYISLGDWRR